MPKFKTKNSSLKSVEGRLICLSSNDYEVKVKLMLLNGLKNRNGWIYKNLQEHIEQFKGKPILISYKNGELGAGHEMDEVKNSDGTISQSFMSATAERIVGYIPKNSKVGIENISGVDWITAEAIIFGWYAPELAERLSGTGRLSESEKSERSMRVSIETLIDEGSIAEDGTEVFTKWRVLGTTILNDKESEAVAGANIRSLSAIGENELRKMTLRVASAQKPANTKKGVKEMPKKVFQMADLREKFPKHTVLGFNGCNVALLSENGRLCKYVFVDGESTVNEERIEEVGLNCSIGEDAEKVTFSIEEVIQPIFAKLSAKVTENTELAKNNSELSEKVQKLETEKLERNKNDVKEAINRRFAELSDKVGEIDKSVCDELLADEKLNEYAKLTDSDGKFCGVEIACKDVDSKCMNCLLTVRKNSKKVFFFESGKNNSFGNTDEGDETEKLVNEYENK